MRRCGYLSTHSRGATLFLIGLLSLRVFWAADAHSSRAPAFAIPGRLISPSSSLAGKRRDAIGRDSGRWEDTLPSQQHDREHRSVRMEERRNGDGKQSFSIGTLFGKGRSSAKSTATSNQDTTTRTSTLPPHPSQRPHISPLNLLKPDVIAAHNEDGSALPLHPDVKSGILPNGLSYIILPNRSPPGRFEAHLQVFSGSGM